MKKLLKSSLNEPGMSENKKTACRDNHRQNI